ncbi:MAG: TetR/AcrR family transcriptional regulator [Bacteroides sp.]|nr:TetR/AcrR family transcriptional regulator [Bacillota bacterium]MCM1394211.1 TetR/AcrR family transcriptional regulator [[Eubacterium] siraeum]MCM1455819.1 TetR/AcrR family transcriptional regulator [Bacteroides sp.]
MDKKEDLRITKSKRDLNKALKELMFVMPFGKITVGDICDKALVNRMTFYRHYGDKYELLNDLICNIQNSIAVRMETPSEKSDNEELDFIFRLLDALVAVCMEEKEFLTVVNKDDLVLTMISTTLEKSVGELLAFINKQRKFRYRLDMLSSAITGAATFLIRHWLIKNPEETAQEFSDKVKQFFKDLFTSKILFE